MRHAGALDLGIALQRIAFCAVPSRCTSYKVHAMAMFWKHVPFRNAALDGHPDCA